MTRRDVLQGSTQVAAVIGSPVGHSLSPAIHNAAFAAARLDWAFLAFDVHPDALPAAVSGMRALGMRGLSVTMPHKSAIAALVDESSDVAGRLGAVNCVLNDGGRLIGHNTDGAGFIDALTTETGFDPMGRRAVVLGAGGAARAIVLALAEAGAGDVAVLNRTPERAEDAAALAAGVGRVGSAADVADADLVVNATPIGMSGAGEGSGKLPVEPSMLRPGQVVADIVYQPLVTPLLAEAAALGASTCGGLGMLVHQAAHAFRHWTGEMAPIAVMEAAARAAADVTRFD